MIVFFLQQIQAEVDVMHSILKAWERLNFQKLLLPKTAPKMAAMTW